MFDADLDFAQACNPDRWTILGVRLKHHCEGHRLLLKQEGSPFAIGGPVTGPDLVLALLICAHTWEQGKEIVAGKYSILRTWLTVLVAICECCIPKFVYKRAEALADYMDEADRLPKGIIREQSRKDGQPIQKTYAPRALVRFSDIANHYHCTFEQLLNMPLRQVTMLQYRLLEIDGTIRWKWWQSKKEQEATSGQ